MNRKTIEQLKTNGPTSLEKIKVVEQKLNIKFPKDYINFMLKYNGGSGVINNNYIIIYKIDDCYKNEEIFPNLIYFGSDGGGEAYAFDQNDNMSIIKVPFICDDVDKCKTIIGNFNDLLEVLKKSNDLDKNLMKTLRKLYGQPNLETVKKQTNNKKYLYCATGDYYIYFRKEIKFDKLNNFFKNYNYDIIFDGADNYICIRSKNTNDCISTEYSVADEKYNEYLIEFENDCKEDSPEDDENWMFDLENMKKFNSYHMIKATSNTEAKYIILLALYILKESDDVLVYDSFNGIYLDSEKLQEIQGKIFINSTKNTTLDKIIQIAQNGIKTYLPEVDDSMLEEKGKLYYMNDEDGTIFDWTMNGRLCEFMSFYDNSRTGAIKINILADGDINVYLYKEKEMQPFKTYQEKISKEESCELAVLMYNIADKRNLYGKAVNDMNAEITITQELYEEFINNELANPFNEKMGKNIQSNKSKMGWILFFGIIIQTVIFILFGVLDTVPILLGLIFFLLIPINIILFLVYVVKYIKDKRECKH